MYMWIGCALPDAFTEPLRERCLVYNRDLGLDTAAFELPQHISLRISFETNRPDQVLAYLTQVLSREKAFSVQLEAIEYQNHLLWIRARHTPELCRLHEMLCSLLLKDFHIPLHPFDKDFLFHTTLFQDPDNEKLVAMYQRIRNYPLPGTVSVDSCLLGISPNGKPGSYQVVQTIKFL